MLIEILNMLKRDKMPLNLKQIYARLRNLSILNTIENTQMRISERLKLVCEHKNWKIKEFAELTGLPYRTMQGYIGGEREPNTEGMTAIAKVGVNLNWLVSGEGKMFISDVAQNDFLTDEISLIGKYRVITDSSKRILQRVAQILYDESVS